MKTGISKGTRVVNYLLDSVVIYVLAIVVAVVLRTPLSIGILSVVSFLYYLMLESLFGKTCGKWVTGTRVRTLANQKPGFWRILLRTLLRFTPLDITSYLFGQEQGIHDHLSGTRLSAGPQKTV